MIVSADCLIAHYGSFFVGSAMQRIAVVSDEFNKTCDGIVGVMVNLVVHPQCGACRLQEAEHSYWQDGFRVITFVPDDLRYGSEPYLYITVARSLSAPRTSVDKCLVVDDSHDGIVIVQEFRVSDVLRP